MVVDAAVESDGDDWFVGFDLASDDRGVAGLVGKVRAELLAVVDHWLVSAVMIDDAESAMDECDIDDRAVFSRSAIAESSLSVWAAMFD